MKRRNKCYGSRNVSNGHRLCRMCQCGANISLNLLSVENKKNGARVPQI